LIIILGLLSGRVREGLKIYCIDINIEAGQKFSPPDVMGAFPKRYKDLALCGRFSFHERKLKIQNRKGIGKREASWFGRFGEDDDEI